MKPTIFLLFAFFLFCIREKTVISFNIEFYASDKFGVLEDYTDSTVLLVEKYEATNLEFLLFCKKFGRKLPASLGQKSKNDDNQPATGFLVTDGKAYCEAKGMRLMTIKDWDLLLRDVDTGFWWGAEKVSNEYAVYESKQTKAVGSLKPVAYGLYDLFGNAAEMVLPDEYRNDNYFYAYGGSFAGSLKWLRVDYPPQKWNSNGTYSHIGCRCVVELNKKEFDKISVRTKEHF